jgi:hypothetical protein
LTLPDDDAPRFTPQNNGVAAGGETKKFRLLTIVHL